MPLSHAIRRLFFLAAMTTALGGCTTLRSPDWPVKEAVPGEPVTIEMAIGDLTAEIVGLDASIHPLEAHRIADTALRLTHSKIDEWQVTRPPLVNNMLINSGMRPRGLCIHWTEDLLKALDALDLETVDLYWVVAKRSRFRIEHSSVVITAKHQVFPEGLVLDGWRNSGMLYWVRVTNDKYQWKMFDRVTGEYVTQAEVIDAIR